MTAQFDTFLEQYLTELMPAELGIGAPAMAKKIAKKASDAPMSGHWKALKRLPDTEKAILDILQAVFPEKDHTYNPDIDNKQELKAAILDAVQNITQKKGYAEKFAADRVTTATVEETAFELANDIMKSNKEVTQKEVRQKLNKKLEEKPAAETETEAMYYRSADLDSEDTDLVKAFNKIPEEGNMKWSDIVAKIGQEAAETLKKMGALIEVVGAEEEDEEKEVPALELSDDDDLDASTDFDRLIDPYFSTTKDDYFRD